MKPVFCTQIVFRTRLSPIKEKSKVLEHMKNGRPYCASARSVKDRMTGEYTGMEDNWKTDGVYCWSEETMYHFDKYNLSLPNEFVEHAVKH